MSGKTFKELKLKSQEIQLNQNSYMLRLTDKNIIQLKPKDLQDIKADSLKYWFSPKQVIQNTLTSKPYSF